ncbi:UNKNOWN [Stylonychia lemnae]|uniref:Uncharacterized protein n=1 Tax=Stylonychia lemnae TaxID=5949 RepID=A0A077ZVE3_STYLE|nr:UNKNOWN [Stylonychia lemnae]|eukprot:CDW73824.1 UNKNOWN [Stylonychia lemnae]
MGCIQDKSGSVIKTNQLPPNLAKGYTSNLDTQENEIKILLMAQSFNQYKVQQQVKQKRNPSITGQTKISLDQDDDKNKSLPQKTLINPQYNETVQNALRKIKHKKTLSKESGLKMKKKQILEIMEIDQQGQIKVDNNNQILAAIQQKAENKSRKAQAKLIRQLKKAKVTFNQNKLQVVYEEESEEGDHSSDEDNITQEKFEKSTIYSTKASSFSWDQPAAVEILRMALQLQVNEKQVSIEQYQQLFGMTLSQQNEVPVILSKRDIHKSQSNEEVWNIPDNQIKKAIKLKKQISDDSYSSVSDKMI